MNKEKFKVICLECEKKFKTSSTIPECPCCHGSDIDLDYENRPPSDWEIFVNNPN